jgi:pimeloyl-ACP methyl ester carboxylesterase
MGVSMEQHRIAMADGVKLYVQTVGTSSYGQNRGRNRDQNDGRQRKAVLFVHPPLLTSSNFLKQLHHLPAWLAPSWSLIAFDCRGHGNSDPSARAVTYEQIIADSIRILDAFEIEQCCLFGYSTGGGVALQALREHPHRFAAAAVASGLARVDDLKLYMRFLCAIGLAKKERIHLLNALVSGGNADTLRMFIRLWRTARKGCAVNIRQYYEAGLVADLADSLPFIKQPVLLMYGEQDYDFHRYAMQLNAGLVNSRLLALVGHKHRLPTFAADEVNRLFSDWLLSLDVLPNARGSSDRSAHGAEQ